MRNAGGYSLQYEGRNIQITIIDNVMQYGELLPQLKYDENYVYYIKDIRAYVYKNIVIASGTFQAIQQEYNYLSVSEWLAMKERKEYIEDFDIRRNRLKSETSQGSVSEIEKRPIEKVKAETPWFTETVMELSVPTIDELNNYFSSIGLEIPGGNF